MTHDAQDEQKKTTLRKIALPVGVGAVSGFLAAFGITFFSEDIGETGLSASAEIATLVGALYLMVAVFVCLGTLRPGAGAKLLNVEDADELREMRSLLLVSSYGMGLWGAALIVLALTGPTAPIAPVLGISIAAGLFLVGTYFAVRSYSHSDELMMSVNREAAVWGYALVFAFLGGWSALAHVSYLPSPAPLDVLSAFYGMVLIATFIAAGRRGMLNVR